MGWVEKEVEETKLNTEEVFKKVSRQLAEKNTFARAKLQEIETTENLLSDLKEQYRKLTEEDMPELMDELGVASVTLTSGERVVLDSVLHCGIPAARKDEALTWLRDNEHGDLIKNEISVKFNKSEDNMVGEVKEVVEKLGLNYEQKSNVHSMTLKAFIKEQMRSGKPLPQDLFGVFVRRVVNVK